MARQARIASLGGMLALAFVWPSIGADRAAPGSEFSGNWARTTFALEQPESGPGPVRTLRRRTDATGDLTFNLGDENSPILKPEAADAVRRRNAMLLSGANVPTPSNQCTPMISPYIFRVQQIQVVQGKDEILFLYMQDHQVRHVRMAASHRSPRTLSAHGDSIGHYEGDTLVVDTIGFKIGQVPTIDQYGTPYSEGLHVVERYRLIDYEAAKEAMERNLRANGAPATEQAAGIDPSYTGKGLQVRFTVEDKNYFTMPWSGAATYRRAGSPWVENVCAENPREYYANRDTPVPQTDKPDF